MATELTDAWRERDVLIMSQMVNRWELTLVWNELDSLLCKGLDVRKRTGGVWRASLQPVEPVQERRLRQTTLNALRTAGSVSGSVFTPRHVRDAKTLVRNALHCISAWVDA